MRGKIRRTVGKRTRRLRWTMALLASGAVLATGLAAYLYRSARPGQYRPGEENPEITRALARETPGDAPAPQFRDVTAAAGLGSFRIFAGERSSQLPEDMGSGAAWGDYDNDGDQDLFLVSAGGNLNLPPAERGASELFQNLGDGRFDRVKDFPNTRIIGMAAAWGDYDGDGWIDLIVSGYRSLNLFRNQEGTFHRVESFPEPVGFWSGVAWGDFDNDGDLDLYVCGYVQYEENPSGRTEVSLQYGRSVPFTLNPVSYRAERNLLFRNEGDGTFSEKGEEFGVANREGRSLGALWHDFDQDGWLDLYVANDISDNIFFHNRRGRFVDISLAAWVADYRGAMGLAAGDWNRDGDDDLFVTHWVAQENALYDSFLSGWKDPTKIPLRFIDVADQRGLGQIALRSVGWGVEFADFDADGWLDLVIANGSTFETDETPRWLRPQLPFLFWNGHGEHFHDLAPRSGALKKPHVGRGLALADYDNDGAVDILFMNHGEGAQLLHNEMQSGHWIEIVLRGRDPDRPARQLPVMGTALEARIGQVRLRRTVGGPSYLSQSSRVIHFGLGEATRIEELSVSWPGRGTDTFTGLDADSVWEVTEGDPVPRRRGSAPSFPVSENDRARRVQFWETQRAAVQAMKVDGDIPAAIRLFRKALAIRPDHEDSLYYLANCLALQGDQRGARELLERLVRNNPQSHRGYKQIGIFLADSATTPGEIEAARRAIEKAVAINPEETGALLVLGEIGLIRGDLAEAERHLSLACQTNPRATGGFFLRAYIAWKSGKPEEAVRLLTLAGEARGEEWKPEGTTSEGDVRLRMHEENTPLSRFWSQWDGKTDPAAAFAALDARLRSRRSPEP